MARYLAVRLTPASFKAAEAAGTNVQPSLTGVFEGIVDITGGVFSNVSTSVAKLWWQGRGTKVGADAECWEPVVQTAVNSPLFWKWLPTNGTVTAVILCFASERATLLFDQLTEFGAW